MTETLIRIDFNKPPEDQVSLHNRWHPDIPMIAWAKPGDDFVVECVDWTGARSATTTRPPTCATST
jgi:formamidase